MATLPLVYEAGDRYGDPPDNPKSIDFTIYWFIQKRESRIIYKR
jgi:hypothetical protein